MLTLWTKGASRVPSWSVFWGEIASENGLEDQQEVLPSMATEICVLGLNAVYDERGSGVRASISWLIVKYACDDGSQPHI